MNRIPRIMSLPLFAALFLCLGGCSERPPSVLLITVDSLRSDQLGLERNGRQVAPNLARLESRSLVFDKAFSPAPWTTPSVMSLMTGLPAPAHCVEEHDRALATSIPTLAERFKKAGYKTAAFAPAITLRPEYGFDRGFDDYHYEPFGHRRISSPKIVSFVRQKLESWKGEPWFIWVHLWDPHYNYNPEPPYDEYFRRGAKPESEEVQRLKWEFEPVTGEEAEYLQGQYEGEVNYTDRYLGEMLDALESSTGNGEVVVALLADHGEAFLEHGWLGHTNRLDQPVVHVPLYLSWPERIPSAKQDDVVSTAQLGRTLLHLAGLEGETFGRHSLLPGIALEGKAAESASGVMSQTVRRGCWTSWMEDEFKYVLEHRTCSEQLFDLSADPGEKNDLSEKMPDVAARMKESLRQELESIKATGYPCRSMPPEVIEQTMQRLMSLGYAGKRPMPPGEKSAARDSFGDLAAQPCPKEYVWPCFSKPE